MKQISMPAHERQETGKKATKALRLAGQVPVTLYGPSLENSRNLSMDRRALEKIAHSHSTMLISLDIDGKEQVRSLLKAHQADPVRGHLIHADFYHVTEDHRLHTVIPVEVTGNSEGVKAGGVLERAIREIEIECLPRDLPENITVDVTDLEIGHSIHVGDLTLPEGVIVRSPEPTVTLVQVVVPRVVVEETPAEEGEELPEGAEAAEGAEGAEGAADEGADGKDKDAKGKDAKGKDVKGKDAKGKKEGGGGKG